MSVTTFTLASLGDLLLLFTNAVIIIVYYVHVHAHTYTHTLKQIHMQISIHTANQIKNVTNNVRIGFGSFNDKVTRPYTYFLGSDGTMPNYAFSHQIKLTNNITFYNVCTQ